MACFKQKTYICDVKFGDLGPNGKGEKFVVDNSILESVTPICVFTVQLLWGYGAD